MDEGQPASPALGGEVAGTPVDRLIAIMARLRDPHGGCPWDLQQTFASLAPYAVEEAYEVADAIERGDLCDLRDELGDLLLQVVFHAQVASEIGAFTFEDVAESIIDKLLRRHPHVFGEVSYENTAAQVAAWESLKAAERSAKGRERSATLADVPVSLPGLLRAVKLTRRAARVGFDWPDVAGVLAKLREELNELEAEITRTDRDAAREELGDVLFTCANLARKLDVDPEACLRAANAKFTRRFNFIESALRASGRKPEDASLTEMDALWAEAKRTEA